MIEAALIPIFLYLPGHFLGGSLARKGDGCAELWLLRIACSAAVSMPILVVLALLGRFESSFVLLALGVCTVIAAHIARRKNKIPARISRWDLVVLVIASGALALYAHPAEYVLKDRDPGVYTVTAAKLARTGELFARDPLVNAVASFHEFEHKAKYPGFFIHDTDVLVPQFFPGPFAWLGLGNLIGGTWGMLYVVPVFGALSVAMAFVLGRELFGGWAGVVGAVLLTVGYVQVWWARYPSSEIITQFLILAGLWSAARFVRGGSVGTGMLAGVLLGGAMLVRVDAFLAALVVPALILHDFVLGRALLRWVSMCVPLLISGGAAILYAGTIGERYLDLIQDLHVPASLPQLLPYLLGGALLAVLSIALVLRYRWGRGLAPRGRQVFLLAALLLLGIALWAHFVLPKPWEGLPEYWGGAEDRMAEFHAYDRQVVVRMVWFITPAVAVLAMAGFVLTAYRTDRARALFMGAFLSFGILYVALPNVAPDLPWATRRFVPVVIPGLCLLAGYAIAETGRTLGRVWGVSVGVACSVTLAGVALVWPMYVAWPIYDVRELKGAIEGFERLNEDIPEAQVVYVESPGEDYAATLDYLYGHSVLVYKREEFRRELPYLRDAGLLGDAVYITGEEQPAPYFASLELREVGREEVSFSRLEDGFKSIPENDYEERQGFRIYALEQR